MLNIIKELTKQYNKGLISKRLLYKNLEITCEKCNCISITDHETEEECNLAILETIMED